MHPLEALASHVLPITKKQQTTCGAPQLITDDIKDSHITTMAGNAMNTPCVGACLIAMVMRLQPVTK